MYSEYVQYLLFFTLTFLINDAGNPYVSKRFSWIISSDGGRLKSDRPRSDWFFRILQLGAIAAAAAATTRSRANFHKPATTTEPVFLKTTRPNHHRGGATGQCSTRTQTRALFYAFLGGAMHLNINY